MSSDAPFPVFRVARWEGDVSNGETSWAGQDLFDKDSGILIASTQRVMSSCTVRHERMPANDEFIVVTTSRREDDEVEWHYQVSNMLIHVMRDELRPDDPESMRERPDVDADAWEERIRTTLTGIYEGGIPTTSVIVRVDDAEVDFQVVSLGRCSGARAILDEVRIEVWGHVVPIDGLSLVSEPEYQHA
jgi:hypothetical protein